MVTDAALALGAPLLVALGLAAGAGRVARARPPPAPWPWGRPPSSVTCRARGWRRVPLVLDGWLALVAALALAAASLERLALADRPAAARGCARSWPRPSASLLLRARATQWDSAPGAAALVAAGVAASGLLLERAAAGRVPAWGLARTAWP
ncbi:MAG: hypothetical protein KF878_19485 [Planctomycetes bacterium]|nr:hypothetical protein [Planctomycetota bacterium]